MDRRVSILAVCVAALLAASGCQDYNFNPVGHCLIQPGTQRFTLSSISTADVLFVVDDSGSMLAEQDALALQFSNFIDILNDANGERVAAGLVPIDFHLAITTTSMFRSPVLSLGSSCQRTCEGMAGSNVCCLGNGKPQPPYCLGPEDCASGYSCLTTAECGEAVSVNGRGCFNNATECLPQPIPCSTVGEECTNLQEFYPTFSGCTPRYADNLFPYDEYPMGRFMAAPGNPLVLHFDKDLYCTWNAAEGRCTDPDLSTPAVDTATIIALSDSFTANVKVGTCGSGQEQGIEAARAAIERARGLRGGQSAGYLAGEFLHPNAKLVVVWVTDEDDCSSPADPSLAVPFWQNATTDACRADFGASPDQQREYQTTEYASYFTSLGRPFSAAVVASFVCDATTGACDAGKCCDYVCTAAEGFPGACTSGACGGQREPYRYVQLADDLDAKEADVLLGSVCDEFGGAGGVLERVARIVKPPDGLELTTIPATGEVSFLRIAGPDGKTRRSCNGPAPADRTAAGAIAEGFDWWFTDGITKEPGTASEHVFIVNQTTYPGSSHPCDANPGETYAVEFIGRLPAPTTDNPLGGCSGVTPGDAEQKCADVLGGVADDWTCFAGTAAGACIAPTAAAPGTCICGSRASNCP